MKGMPSTGIQSSRAGTSTGRTCLPLQQPLLRPDLAPPFSPVEDVDQIVNTIETLLEEPPAVAARIRQFSMSAFALVSSGSMASVARRAATARLATSAVARGKTLQGDLVETGMNTGGTAVVILKVLNALGQGQHRKFWDSIRSVVSPNLKVAGSGEAGPSAGKTWQKADVQALDRRFVEGIPQLLGGQ